MVIDRDPQARRSRQVAEPAKDLDGCHWNDRLAGVMMSVRLTRPRIFISLSSSPAMIVLPAPGSSARRNRMRGRRRK